MKPLFVFFDCECFLGENGDVHVFVGLLINSQYKKIELHEFVDYISVIRQKLDSSRPLGLVCFNFEYDGRILEEAWLIRDQYSKDHMLMFSNGLIEKSTQISFKFKYCRFGMLLNDFPRVYIFDVYTDLQHAASTDFSKGSLEYHASKLGFKWSETIESNIVQYNKEDLLATEAVFYAGGGGEVFKTNVYIVEHILQRRVVNLSLTLLTSIFIKTNLLQAGETLPTGYTELDHWKQKFKIPFEGIYAGGQFQFYRDDGTLTNMLHNFKFELNDGGLHFGINNTRWKNTDESKLYNLDFGSLYPFILISPLCPVLNDHSKKILARFVDRRMQAKKAGDDVFSTAAKKILVTVYGMMYRFGKLATIAVCFLAQISIAWVCSIFDKSDTKIIDVNTDGVLIYTKLPIDELVLKVERFNRACEERLHNSKLEISPIDEVLYANSNNYLFLLNGKVVKAKGSFLHSPKMQKMTYNVAVSLGLSEPFPAFNIVNYDKIIRTFLETTEYVPAIVLQKKGGKKIQHFDGLPFVTGSIHNPSLNSTIKTSPGVMTPLEISKACVTGFLSHFRKSDLFSDLGDREFANFDAGLKELQLEDARKRGAIFVPFFDRVQLTIGYQQNELTTWEDLAVRKEPGQILLANEMVIPKYNRTPIMILDLDFKTLIKESPEEFEHLKSHIWRDLREKLSHLILYAETFAINSNELRKGIHVFLEQHVYHEFFTDFFPELQDRSYTKKKTRKSITLYKKTGDQSDLLELGRISDIVPFYRDMVCVEKKTKKQATCVPKQTFSMDSALAFVQNLDPFPDYDRWLVQMTTAVDTCLLSGLTPSLVEKELYKSCLHSSEGAPATEQKKRETLNHLRRLIAGHGTRRKEDSLYLLSKTTKGSNIAERVNALKKLYYPRLSDTLDLDSFFQLKNHVQVIQAVTGAGKTVACVAAMLKRVKQRKPFVFVTNSKMNIKNVLGLIIDAFVDSGVQHLYDFFLANHFVLNTDTSARYQQSLFIFTTFHYFLPTDPFGNLYKITLNILAESERYDWFFDEFDEFIKASERCYVNGERFKIGLHPVKGEFLQSMTYCPRKYSIEDHEDICTNCDLMNVAAFEISPQGVHTQKIPEEIHPKNDSAVLFTADFLNSVSLTEETQIFENFFRYRMVFDKEVSPTTEFEKLAYTSIAELEYASIGIYKPTVNGVPADPFTDVCDGFPHYTCGVARATGLLLSGLRAILKNVKTHHTSAYFFSATISTIHFKVLSDLVQSIFKEQLEYLTVPKVVEKHRKITVCYSGMKFKYENAFNQLSPPTPVLVFFARKHDAEAAFKNSNVNDSRIVFFQHDEFLYHSKSHELENASWVFTYSGSVLGRGIEFKTDVVCIDCEIYKPFWAYIDYFQGSGIKCDALELREIYKISYILQNLGRVLRGYGPKKIILFQATQSLARFIADALQIKSEAAIDCENVTLEKNIFLFTL